MPHRERNPESGAQQIIRSGFMCLDPFGYIKAIDRPVARVLGYAPEELSGRLWWDFVPEVERPHRTREFERFMEAHGVEYLDAPYSDTRVITKEGRSRWIRWSSMRKMMDGPHVVGLRARGVDVTSLYYERRATIPGLYTKGKC